MNVTERNYFLAIMPPEPIQSEIQKFKIRVAENFQSKGALRSPAHVTLVMPFLYKEKNVPELITSLTTFAATRKSFSISLAGFGGFEPRVVFVNVLLSEELLDFKQSLARYVKQHHGIMHPDFQDKGFQPHITIGFRDLKKQQYKPALDSFQEITYLRNFSCSTLSLLRKENEMWMEYKSFQFGN